MFAPHVPGQIRQSDVLICPYDKSHLISRMRIQKHIEKCEKNYPVGFKEVCPYNATHRLFKHEMAAHIVTCPNKCISGVEVYESGSRRHRVTGLMLHSKNLSTIDCEENWDAETNNDSISSLYNESPLKNDAVRLQMDLGASAQNKDICYKHMRAPKGLSEAMMRDVDEESCIEDVESLVSSMGIGRGKVFMRNHEILKQKGLGKGRAFNKDF